MFRSCVRYCDVLSVFIFSYNFPHRTLLGKQFKYHIIISRLGAFASNQISYKKFPILKRIKLKGLISGINKRTSTAFSSQRRIGSRDL